MFTMNERFRKVSIEEMASFMLSSVILSERKYKNTNFDVVISDNYTISMYLPKDEADYNKLVSNGKPPYFGVLCTKLFEDYQILIDGCNGVSHTFRLPFFDENIDVSVGEEQPEDVLQACIRGLENFFQLMRSDGYNDSGNYYIDVDEGIFVEVVRG